MARGRIQNRMEKRAEHEAYERRQAEDEEEHDDEEDEDEDEDEEEEEDATEGEAGDEEGGEEEAPAPPPKKKKAAPPKEPKKPRSRARTAKIVRMKLVWGVFNNSNVRVATYEYRQKPEAEEHAARLSTEKKSTHFVQPVKEAIEEKKEA
jgi:cobalamin biosynthesis protein CobT